MSKKMFPILIILLIVLAWTNIFMDGYSKPKQYESLIQEGNMMVEKGLYLKAIDKYNNAYSIKANNQLYDQILECYLRIGDKDLYINGCLDGIKRYKDCQKFYERVLEYYSKESESDFIKYVVEYKNIFPDNSTIDNYYKQASHITYLLDNMEKKPTILSDKYYLCLENKYNYETGAEYTAAIVKDLYGTQVFLGNYCNIRLAEEGYFVQETDGRWSLVNENGYVISKTERKTITDIVGKAAGCYVVIDNGKYKLMNNDMEFANMEYDYISSSSDGVYAVCKKGKWAIVPDDVIFYEGDYPYEEVMINSQGLCSVNNCIVVKQDGKYGIINTKQEKTYESNYSLIKAYEDSQQTVFCDGQKYGYMYADGSTFIDPTFDDAMPYKMGAAAIKVGDKWGFIDEYGNIIVEPVFQEVTSILSNGKALVLDEDGYWKILTIPLLNNLKN